MESFLKSTAMQREVSSIFETFYLFDKVLSVFGFLPFQVNKGQISSRSLYYSIHYALIYTVMLLILCILGQNEPDAEESLFVRYGCYLQYLQSLVVVLFSVLFNYFKRQKIANCLVIMHHFDCALQVGHMEEIVIFSCNLFHLF